MAQVAGAARLAGATVAPRPRRSGSIVSTCRSLSALVPNLGIGGKATGSLDFAQANSAALPDADARMTVTNFTRTGLAAVSDPVDIVFAGRSGGDGGDRRALVRRGYVGRRPDGRALRPLPAGMAPGARG